jgi:hypothetical protein|nr:MAG TPA: hypothetical protein [Caudoviricetes sp.]
MSKLYEKVFPRFLILILLDINKTSLKWEANHGRILLQLGMIRVMSAALSVGAEGAVFILVIFLFTKICAFTCDFYRKVSNYFQHYV